MADTIPVVGWALQRACPLRRSPDWQLPENTQAELYRLKHLGDAIRRHMVVDDICITLSASAQDAAGRGIRIPTYGYRVLEVCGELGGYHAVRATCAECEANVGLDPGEGVAGCFGHFYCDPWSEEVESLIQDQIAERGLRQRMTENFLGTKPAWFGLWAISPLNRSRCEVLLDVLPAVGPLEADESGLPSFLEALRGAIDWELPLHVEMGPPGHVDFGFHTVFAHCPRCKAECPDVPRWKVPKETAFVTCPVCGFGCNPAATAKTEPDGFNRQESSLRSLLGEGYEAFVVRYGLAKGLREDQMRQALAYLRHQEEERKAAAGRFIRNAPPPVPTLEAVRQHNVQCVRAMVAIERDGFRCPHCKERSRAFRLATRRGYSAQVICRKCGWPVDPDDFPASL